MDSVEIFSLDDNNWNVLTDKLTIPVLYSRVVYEDEIVMLVGQTYNGFCSNIINVINGITHRIYSVTSYIDIDIGLTQQYMYLVDFQLMHHLYHPQIHQQQLMLIQIYKELII